MSSKISGIFVPNLAPALGDGALNETELRRIVSWHIEKGVHGLFPNGSTGEFARLTADERRRVIEIVADETRGRVPILAGTGEATVREIIRTAEHYAALGCRAITVTGAIYFKPTPTAIDAFFTELAAHSPVDIVLYNIPQFCSEIPLDTVVRLALESPRVVGIKDSSQNFVRFQDMLRRIKPGRPDFACMIGAEELLLPALLMGADGATIGAAAFAPELILRLVREFERGDLEAAKASQFQILQLTEAVGAVGNFPEGARLAMQLRGFDPGPRRHPLSRAEEERLAHFRGAIETVLRPLVD